MNDELIIRYLSGDTSAEEERTVLAWIGQSPENEKHFQVSRKVFELAKKHYTTQGPQGLPINVDQEWNQFVDNIDNKKTRTLPQPAQTTWMRMAAALLIALMSGAIFYFYTNRNREILYQAAENTLDVSLPDGSHVILNSHSELSYQPGYGDEDRRVKLKGEAFFDVARNAAKPFIITVNQAEVEVLGTSFDVQAYDERDALEVVVETGIVKFSVPSAKGEVTITAGQMGVYSKTGQHMSSFKNGDPNYLSWNTRKLVFEEIDLRTVIAAINKTYHSNIVLPKDVPASCVVTVTFDRQTLEAVLNVLKTTLNLTYKMDGDRIEITQTGC